METDMRSRHASVLNHFMGTGCRATRNSSNILRKVGAVAVEEALHISLFDSSSNCFRTIPLSTLWTSPISPEIIGVAPKASHWETQSSVSLKLQRERDSDDCDSSLPSERRGQEIPRLRAPKRTRDGFWNNDDIQSLKRFKMSYINNPSMLRSIDQLIAVRESSVSSATTSDLLVNGTYALMDAQLLLETIQVQHEQISFLLHPSILRAMFNWEFGLHRRPQALVPAHLSDIIDALDCLGLVVSMVLLPYVSDLVDAARKLVVLLKSQQGFTSATGRGELVHWINGRLERFRGRLARQYLEEAKVVRLQFSVADPSFIRVTQIITAACVQDLRAQQLLPHQPTAPLQS
ncbi:hypothetical protein L917_12894 [Phytophthora nicotianae]|uniref:Uncharacterized protein n=1 Tax=Phytophthora nicotianae TaxID=4792 RepID=W2KS58_PHYNI|nr:hypothetical protein L917_12894 [Phytophthora nicotianae]